MDAGDLTVIALFDKMRKSQARTEVSAADARQKQQALEREVAERTQAQENERQLFDVVQTVNRAEALPAIFDAALEAICKALRLDRAAVLFSDDDGMMRFKAWRGLSEEYRRAVEGHSPWRRDELDPEPVCWANMREAPLEEHLREVVVREGIGALAFIPLTYEHRLIGKFMVYYNEAHVFTEEEIRLAQTIASQVAFAAVRQKGEEALQRSEARLRLAVDTAELGLYDRDLVRNEAMMDANCRKIMGLPPEGPLRPDVAVASLHPEDRNLVLPLVAQAFDPQLREVCGADFRILTPQGQVRWVSGRGRVIFDDTVEPARAMRFIGVLQDISARKELELEIQRSRAELQRYAQELEERVAERTANLQQTIESLEGVLYHVAHDLRAPLRAMHSFSSILVQNYASSLDATGTDYARRIADSSARMDALIRDLLIYGRMGHQVVTWSSVDLNALFERLLDELHPEITHRQAEIQLHRPLPRVWGDPKILEQVILNLLTNALKFTAPNAPPRIHIWGEMADGTVSLSIRDQGIGIAAEYHERIFGIFERLQETESYPGTGIGLAIVKKGIDLLGGQVQVESELGQGSRFILRLKSTPQV